MLCVCLPQLCSSAGSTFAVSRLRLDCYWRVEFFLHCELDFTENPRSLNKYTSYFKYFFPLGYLCVFLAFKVITYLRRMTKNRPPGWQKKETPKILQRGILAPVELRMCVWKLSLRWKSKKCPGVNTYIFTQRCAAFEYNDFLWIDPNDPAPIYNTYCFQCQSFLRGPGTSYPKKLCTRSKPSSKWCRAIRSPKIAFGEARVCMKVDQRIKTQNVW